MKRNWRSAHLKVYNTMQSSSNFSRPRKGNQNCSTVHHIFLEAARPRTKELYAWELILFLGKRQPSKPSCQHCILLQTLLHTVDRVLKWHATFIRPTLRRDIQHQQQQIEKACFWIRQSRNSWSHSALVDFPWFPKRSYPTVVRIRWSYKVQEYGTSSEIYPRKTHGSTCPKWSPTIARLQANTNTLRGYSSYSRRESYTSANQLTIQTTFQSISKTIFLCNPTWVWFHLFW